MQSTEIMFAVIAGLGTLASGAFTYILAGIRTQLTEHRVMLIDQGKAIARIEGARAVEKE